MGPPARLTVHATPTSSRGRRSAIAAAVSILCVVAGSLLFLVGLLRPTAPSQPPTSVGLPSSSSPAEPPASPATSTALPRAKPLSLVIPAIDLRTEELVPLSRTPSGKLEVPQEWDTVGWYKSGPWPGEPGSAVLAGHVDSTSGPAVFYRLSDLRPGKEVIVRRADGTAVTFSVYAVERYSKDDFPTRRVYGPTDRHPELRLITCGGSFNEETQHYRSNIVAYAKLTSVEVE